MAKKKENKQKPVEKPIVEKPIETQTDENLTVLKTILEQNNKMIELLEKIVERIGG